MCQSRKKIRNEEAKGAEVQKEVATLLKERQLFEQKIDLPKAETAQIIEQRNQSDMISEHC